MRRSIGAAIASMAVVYLAAVGGAASGQSSRWGADYFPNVELTTQYGTTVRFYDDLIKGKIVAINLIYTTCKFACPLETARLVQVQRLLGDRMGRDVFFYSITLDPEHDTPAVLKAYADAVGAGPGWLFLTGRKEDIDTISRKTGLYSPPNPSSADGHTPHLLVGNEESGQWIRNSSVDNPKFLATTIGTWMTSWRGTSAPKQSYADAPAVKFAPGEYEFTRYCAPCHSIGGGDGIGPDLRGVMTRRQRDWLTQFVMEPDRVRASGDPIARSLSQKFGPPVMPRLGLSPSDVAQLLGYIERQSAGGVTAPATPAAVATAPAVALSARADVAAMLDPYLAIQRGLNADSVEGVAQRARSLGAAAGRAGSAATSIQSAAAALERGRSIAVVRDAFARVTDELIAYAREQRVAFGGDVKVAYCPMADRYWLQRGGTVANPYYGRQMSNCGRFVPELPAGRARHP